MRVVTELTSVARALLPTAREANVRSAYILRTIITQKEENNVRTPHAITTPREESNAHIVRVITTTDSKEDTIVLSVHSANASLMETVTTITQEKNAPNARSARALTPIKRAASSVRSVRVTTTTGSREDITVPTVEATTVKVDITARAVDMAIARKVDSVRVQPTIIRMRNTV